MLEKINHKSAPKEVVKALVTLYHEGNFDDVLSRSSHLIKEYPHTFVLHNIVGAISFEKGHKEVAIKHFRKAIELRPHHPHAYNNLGTALIDISEYQEAKSNLKKAIELQPDYAEAYNNLGNVYKEMEEYNMAISKYKKAIRLNPEYHEAYNNLGAALGKNEQYEEEIEAYKTAISLNPDFAESYNNMGIALKEQGKLDEALEAYNKALSLKPDYADAYYNIGIALQDQGKLEEAIKSYNKALSLKPDFAESHQNLSFALLNYGKIKEGLSEYEWRWKNNDILLQNRNFSIPVWDGQKSLQGKRILLWSEQGIGDTINWSSRLPLISSQAQHCTLECPEKLVPLLRRSFPNIEIKTEDKSRDALRDDIDFHLPLGSLYKQFLPEILKEAKADAYLVADPVRFNFWKQRLKSLGPGPYIGVSWKSSNMSPKRLPNYAPISEWSPIFKLHGITYINLQYVDYESDLAKIKSEFGVTVNNFDDLDHYNNLDDVAALCAALDMVVSTKITVPLISSGIGTITKLANWRQSRWNNILHNPVGPAIDIFERNTWEPWFNVFDSISADIIKLKTKKNSTSRSL